ncbi:MAG: pilus assembly protein TadG-related protein, partial [Anaerolineae bacterium]
MFKFLKKLNVPYLNRERGQSLVILAFSFVGLVALLGFGLDLGLVYIERTALKRAIDAAVLSGVTELSNEEEAGLRAIDYLGLNDYDLSDSNIYFRGCITDRYDYYDGSGTYCGSAGCGEGNLSQIVNAEEFYPYQIVNPDDKQVRNVFQIDTYAFQTDHATGCQNSPPALGDANKLLITGTVKVNMNFMRLIGFPYVEVPDHAIAQNLDNLDVAVVLDRSGSMEFDPVCYGCWVRRDALNPSDPNYLTAGMTINDSPRYRRYNSYPENGVIYPLGGTDGFENPHRIRACTTDTYDADQDLPVPKSIYTWDVNDSVYRQGGWRYIIMEAELYSLNPAPVAVELQEQGKGYWAMQRGEGNYDSEALPYIPSQGTSIDSIGVHMSHHPSTTETGGTIYGNHYTLAQAQSGNAPWLEYDFRFYNGAGWIGGSTANIWIRVHAGRGLNYDTSGGPWWGDTVAANSAYWGLVTRPIGNPFPLTYFPPPGSIQATNPNVSTNSSGFDSGYRSYWHWIYIGNTTIDFSQQYRFYFFAGSTGYNIDRIVITDDPGANSNNSAQDGAALGNARFNSVPVTAGSAARAACDICNAVYGENIADPTQCTLYPELQLIQEPTNNALNPLFNEWEAPMRTTKEAIKFFITRLDPERDQAGYVTYNSSSVTKAELACVRAAAPPQNVNCVTGSSPISYTEVLLDVEQTRASAGTPTAYGMRAGLEVLGFATSPSSGFDTNCDGTPNSSCSRGGGAQKVLILLTDGMPNSTNWSYGCTSAKAPTWSGTNNASHRCPLWFAEEAKKAGITVYTIGLGCGVNRDYLKEIA